MAPHSGRWNSRAPCSTFLLVNFQKQTAVFALVPVLDVLQEDGERLVSFAYVFHSQCGGWSGRTREMCALVAVLLRARCEEPDVPQLVLRMSLGSRLKTRQSDIGPFRTLVDPMGHRDTERVTLTARWRDRERKQWCFYIRLDVYVLDLKSTFSLLISCLKEEQAGEAGKGGRGRGRGREVRRG